MALNLNPMFQDLSLTYLLALTENPETPTVILETLWRELEADAIPSLEATQKLQLRLNITSNPSANQYILTEAINGHHELFLNAISHPKINPKYLESLLVYKNLETTEIILSRLDLPLTIRQQILNTGEIWEQAILAARYDLTPLEASALLPITSIIDTDNPKAPEALKLACALASNPLIGDFDNKLSESIWTTLANYNFPEINAALFRNPALPPALFNQLYDPNDRSQLPVLASTVTISPQVLQNITQYAIANSDQNIMLALAGNASLPSSAAQALIATGKKDVLRTLALSTEDTNTRKALAQHSDPEISAIARDSASLLDVFKNNWNLDEVSRILELSPNFIDDAERLGSINASLIFSNPTVTRFAVEHFATSEEVLKFYKEAITEITFLHELGLENAYLANITVNKVLENTQSSLRTPGFTEATEAPKTSGPRKYM
jgi:hypothetical protein